MADELHGLAWLAQKANEEYRRRPIPKNPRPLDAMDIKIIRELTNNDMNITETANAVFMHRNSVVHRAKRIKEKTGLSPLKFFDLCKLLKLVKK